MNFYVWTDEIIAHLAEHGVSPADFEYVLENLGASVNVLGRYFVPKKARAIHPAGHAYGDILKMGVT
jgi:hypothetical protein